MYFHKKYGIIIYIEISFKEDKMKELQKFIDNSKNIVFFGGAGVSTEIGYLVHHLSEK